MNKELRGRERGAQREEHELERERVKLRGDSGSIQIYYMPGSCMIINTDMNETRYVFFSVQYFYSFSRTHFAYSDLYKYDSTVQRTKSG